MLLEQISEMIQEGRTKDVKALVKQAAEEGIPPQTILDEGLLKGMNIIGEKFKNDEVFVPEVLITARAMNKGAEVLKAYMSEGDIQKNGKVCLGTVAGDLHDIGKNLVKLMLEAKGLEVVDLGVDVPVDKFIETAGKEGCKVICCSALLTTTMGVMKDVVDAAAAAGLRDRVKIMIGGAPVTDAFCKEIGADYYTADAASAADKALELCLAS